MRLFAEVVVVLVVALSAGLAGIAFGAHRQAQNDAACRSAGATQVAQTGTTHPLPLACGLAAVTTP